MPSDAESGPNSFPNSPDDSDYEYESDFEDEAPPTQQLSDQEGRDTGRLLCALITGS